MGGPVPGGGATGTYFGDQWTQIPWLCVFTDSLMVCLYLGQF